MLQVLDTLLFILHMIVVFGNLLGWIWKKTRKAHLILVGTTLLSWFLLGAWKGWGYCVLTDWHWDVKRALGEKPLPSSFTQYLANNLLHLDLSNQLVDLLTVIGLVIALVATIIVNWNFIIRKK